MQDLTQTSNLKTFCILKRGCVTPLRIRAEGAGYDDAGNLALLATKLKIATKEDQKTSYVVAVFTISRDVLDSFWLEDEMSGKILPVEAAKAA